MNKRNIVIGTVIALVLVLAIFVFGKGEQMPSNTDGIGTGDTPSVTSTPTDTPASTSTPAYDSAGISENRQVLYDKQGNELLTVSTIVSKLKQEMTEHDFDPITNGELYINEALRSPNGTMIAIGASATMDHDPYGFTLLLNANAKTLQLLHQGGHPTFWSPDSKHVVVHAWVFECEFNEMVYNVETMKKVRTIDNTKCDNPKTVTGWSSINMIRFSTKDRTEFKEQMWSYNIETGKENKVSEVAYIPKAPNIFRAYMSQSDKPDQTMLAYTAEGIAQVKLYYATSQSGPWKEHQDFKYQFDGGQLYFVPPEVKINTVYYRITGYANDGRETAPSNVVSARPTCCWESKAE